MNHLLIDCFEQPFLRFTALFICAVTLANVGFAAPPASPEWTRQFGTSGADFSYGVSADSFGNVYVSGYTTGNLGGSNAGGRDTFLRKYDAQGSVVWTRQLGTSALDISFGVSADDLGNVFISGLTEGNLGGTNSGDTDAFVSKYDSAGSLAWTRQIGTPQSDIGFEVSADGLGSVYITGHTNGSLGGPIAGGSDSFLSKFDSGGNLLWSRQQGTAAGDGGEGLAADGAAGIYVSGATMGNLGGTNAGSFDAFVSKYDPAGNVLWVRQLGTSSYDQASAASSDGVGNVYIAGYTEGSLGGPSAGDRDAFVAKYDAFGSLQWTRQLGTSSLEEAFGVSADGLGNVYITGYSTGSLSSPNSGGDDFFISKYDDGGNFIWTRQLGTSSAERGQGISTDGLGNVYAAGYTLGSLGGTSLGFEDGVVIKFAEVPEPTLAFLLCTAALALVIKRQR